MNKRALVTGASGFVGSCLTRRLLKENCEVHIIARETSDLWRLKDVLKDLRIHNTEITSSEEVAKLAESINIDQVYHLAVYGGYHYQSKLEDIVNTNLIGTWNLFKEFSKKNIEMFINTSSSSEYGEKFEPMKEDMKLEPNNMYGASKASGTILCSTYAKVNKIPLVTFRLFSPYGYYDSSTRLIPTVITSCLLEKEIKLSQKNAKRDFIFREDVLEAYLLAIKLKDAYGEVINIGSGNQYTIEQVANIIISLIGKDVKVQWKKDLSRQYEPLIWSCDNKKAYEKLNWKPNVDITKGLNNTINWFRDNLEFYR